MRGKMNLTTHILTLSHPAFAVFMTLIVLTTIASAESRPSKIERNFSKLVAGEYQLDKTHASVTWRVSHLGLSLYTARFDKMDGKMSLMPEAPSASRVEFIIDAASISSGLMPFDKILRGTKYFDVEKNANIVFKSTKVDSVGDNRFKVAGDLTLRGVTKPIIWDVTFNGGIYNGFAQAYAVGFSAKGLVKRSDWGMTEQIGVAGDEVEVLVEVEFLHRNATK